jgi:methylmalonyl-CoA mutase N-terminal domain/subunit
VLMEETGVVNVADPLGGSWYVEALTDEMEAQAEQIFAKVLEMGGGADREHAVGPMTSGILRGIEDGWFMAEIADAAFAYQRHLEKGDKRIVGVNCHESTVTGELEILRVSHEVEVEQVAELGERRQHRDQAEVDAALQRMVEAVREQANVIPPMLDAARAEATLGEICDALRAEWGEYRERAQF